jgi:predicted nucleic acid-binding protein
MTGTKREFVDTNVLVYAYNCTFPEKQLTARTLLTGLWGSEQGCLSLQVLQEFYSVVTRKIPHPLSSDTAALIIKDYGNWIHHVPEIEDLLEAIRIQQKYGISFWDALVIRSAVALDCGVIWSEDLNAGQLYEGVSVMNPFLEAL